MLINDRSSHPSGTTTEVLTEENLSRLYGVPIGRARFAGRSEFTFAPMFDRRDRADARGAA